MSRHVRIVVTVLWLAVAAAALLAYQPWSQALEPAAHNSAGAAQLPDRQVSIQDFAFVPQTILIPVGTTVRWTNHGAVSHTVTSDTGAFDSGAIAPNENFDFQFNTAGTYPYHCMFHPSMTGVIVVAQQVSTIYLPLITR